MIGSTHMIIGCGAGMMVSSGAGIPQMVAGGCLGAVVALLPDIDHPNSRVSNFLGWLALPFRLIPHRTLTHAVWIPLALVVWWVSSPQWAIAAIATAYTSHIVADGLTPRGVPLLYPLSKINFGVGIIRTGGFFERIFALIVLGGILLYWGAMANG